jgi:hypothetical protein
LERANRKPNLPRGNQEVKMTLLKIGVMKTHRGASKHPSEEQDSQSSVRRKVNLRKITSKWKALRRED